VDLAEGVSGKLSEMQTTNECRYFADAILRYFHITARVIEWENS
jgi:hypothetical protein